MGIRLAKHCMNSRALVPSPLSFLQSVSESKKLQPCHYVAWAGVNLVEVVV